MAVAVAAANAVVPLPSRRRPRYCNAYRPPPLTQAMDFDELVESAREIGLDPDSVAVAIADDSRAALEAGVLEALLERARVTDGKHRSQPRELGGMARDGSRFDSW